MYGEVHQFHGSYGIRSDSDGKSLHKTTVSVPLGCPYDTLFARSVSRRPASRVLGVEKGWRGELSFRGFRERKTDQKQDKVSCEIAEDVEGRKELEELFEFLPTLGMIRLWTPRPKEENFHVFAILNMPFVVF